jgi:hypothetical protein
MQNAQANATANNLMRPDMFVAPRNSERPRWVRKMGRGNATDRGGFMVRKIHDMLSTLKFKFDWEMVSPTRCTCNSGYFGRNPL